MDTKTNLDLSIDCTGEHPDARWWECPRCGDYAWLCPGQGPPVCSCVDEDEDAD
jgi:hypothetical protein